jgi:hypothetical protein
MSTARPLAAAMALVILFVGASPGQDEPEYSELPVSNWSAPPFWSLGDARGKNVGEVLAGEEDPGLQPMGGLPSPPLPLTAINPCRIVDTRGANGSFGGPALVANATRTFILPAGPCPGLPADAGAWSLNFTVIGGAGTFQGGFLTAWPTGSAQPLVSTLNFNASQLVANAAVVPAGTAGAIDVFVNAPAHLLIDINGYYKGVSIVNTVNNLSGAVTLAPGTDVTITPAGNTLTIGTDATSNNTLNTIVRRNGTTGGFSAGTVILDGNIVLQGSGSTAGNVVYNGNRLLHTTGPGVGNVFLGLFSGNFATTGDNNTAVGGFAMEDVTDGIDNVAVGFRALGNNLGGDENTAVGRSALAANTIGLRNTAVGDFALSANTGDDNIALGRTSGQSLSSGSNNIYIGNSGAATESNTIRIGRGTHDFVFIEGIRGVTTGQANGLAVLIDTNGQLGTISSSASVKREIADIGEASAPLSKLRPVSFLYRNDTEGIPQYGLIAEEVARVMPELVQFSPAGSAETVRYHFLAPLLLNELQKEQRRNGEQELRIENLLARLDALEARISGCETPTE